MNGMLVGFLLALFLIVVVANLKFSWLAMLNFSGKGGADCVPRVGLRTNSQFNATIGEDVNKTIDAMQTMVCTKMNTQLSIGPLLNHLVKSDVITNIQSLFERVEEMRATYKDNPIFQQILKELPPPEFVSAMKCTWLTNIDTMIDETEAAAKIGGFQGLVKAVERLSRGGERRSVDPPESAPPPADEVALATLLVRSVGDSIKRSATALCRDGKGVNTASLVQELGNLVGGLCGVSADKLDDYTGDPLHAGKLMTKGLNVAVDEIKKINEKLDELE